MKKSKKMSGGKKVMVGASVAALAGGAYYLLGPKSKAHQKKAKALMNKVEREVRKIDVKKLEKEIKSTIKKVTKKPTKVSKAKRS